MLIEVAINTSLASDQEAALKCCQSLRSIIRTVMKYSLENMKIYKDTLVCVREKEENRMLHF